MKSSSVSSVLFQKKSLSEIREQAGRSKLAKNLSAFDLVQIGLGAIIGTGIFVITGLAASEYAGPAITLSFVLGGIASIFTAFAFAELASLLPSSGGAYTYAFAAFGESIAAWMGWTIVMLCTFGSGTVAAGWSGYMVGLLKSFGIDLPQQWTRIPTEGGIMNLPAMLIVAVITLSLIRGMKEAKQLNLVLNVIKLGAIGTFMVCAAPHVQIENWTPFAPNGLLGITLGAGFVFMAYNGFDSVATAAEECRNPARDLPIGIIGSLVGSAILYVVVSGLLTAIVPYTTLNNSQSMAGALRANGVQIGATVVAVGALAGMTTVILTQVFGQSRVLFVMARDQLLPRLFETVHPRFSTPLYGILLSGLGVMLIAGFMPVATLGQISSMSSLVLFASVSLAVMVMRRRHPQESRAFWCPKVYWMGSVSFVLCLALFFQLFLRNWLPFLVATSIGMSLYFLKKGGASSCHTSPKAPGDTQRS